jgi:exodeoxyribonuclease VII large subunit
MLAYPTNSEPLTVSQVSTYLKHHIEKGFAGVCIQGEVSSCKMHSSGHTYLCLKDDGAVLDAICWRGTRLQTPLTDGLMVTCQGKMTSYGARSKYQFIIESAQPAGLGALLQMIQALKTKLRAEGLFDSDRKKPLPTMAERIGLITSPTGAVLQDMLARFAQRLPCQLVLYPVTVQGPTTVPEVCAALKYFHTCPNPPQLLILARGGGSLEDLWAFQDENLVRAVAASRIPIISAIGHETDTTLVDYVSDARAPTPTAAAEMALPMRQDVQNRIETLSAQMKRCIQHMCSLANLRLNSLTQRLPQLANWLRPLEQRLDVLEDDLAAGLRRVVWIKEHQLALAGQRLSLRVMPDTKAEREHLQRLGQRLERSWTQTFYNLTVLIDGYGRLLGQMSYQRTLERGFVLLKDSSGKNLTQLDQLAAQKDQPFSICLVDGQLKARLVDPDPRASSYKTSPELPDGALPDASLPDGALPSAGLPDAGLPPDSSPVLARKATTDKASKPVKKPPKEVAEKSPNSRKKIDA